MLQLIFLSLFYYSVYSVLYLQKEKVTQHAQESRAKPGSCVYTFQIDA